MAFRSILQNRCLHPVSYIRHVLSAGKPNRTLFTALPVEDLAPRSLTRLKDVKYIPDSTGEGFPEFLAPPKASLPHAVRVNDPDSLSINEWGARCREYIDQTIPKENAVLFRDLPLRKPEDLKDFFYALGYKAMKYVGGLADRNEEVKDEHIYTSSEYPPEMFIEPHNEMSPSATFPHKIFFFCLQEPTSDGHTPLVKNHDLMNTLDPKVLRKFAEKNILYTRYFPDKSMGDPLPWQQAFFTDNREEVESIVKKFDVSEISWDEGGGLFFSQNRPAFRQHPNTGEMIWFNQIHSVHNSVFDCYPDYEGRNLPDRKYPYHSYYGDGSTIEPAVLQNIRTSTWSCAVGFQWQKSDLLVLDNLLVQHGRTCYEGPRRLLVHLTSE